MDSTTQKATSAFFSISKYPAVTKAKDVLPMQSKFSKEVYSSHAVSSRT